MILVVKRFLLDNEFTIGNLYIDKKFYCNTLEDRDRDLNSLMSVDDILKKKVYSKTAIPIGDYHLTIDYSNKYKKNLPHILNVKGYDGIRLHSLNYASESLGCIGLGDYNGENAIINSRATMKVVQPIIQNAIDNKEEVMICICYEDIILDRRK